MKKIALAFCGLLLFSASLVSITAQASDFFVGQELKYNSGSGAGQACRIGALKGNRAIIQLSDPALNLDGKLFLLVPCASLSAATQLNSGHEFDPIQEQRLFLQSLSYREYAELEGLSRELE